MAKRKAPVSETSSHFLSLYQAYPRNFDWEIDEDVLKLVRWIATCIGSHQSLYAFYYKPKAAVIVLEVEKRNDNSLLDRVLGEHRWKEMLLHPHKDENGFSQIFPCLHTDTVALKKDGWHCVYVKPEWFDGWLAEKVFKDPYPTPSYCDTPNESAVTRPLCRKLPAAVRAPLVEPPRPIVPGSSAWTGLRSGANDIQGQATRRKVPAAKPPMRRAWNMPISQSPDKPTSSQPTSSSLPHDSSLAFTQRQSPMPSAWAKPIDFSRGPPGLIHPSMQAAAAKPSIAAANAPKTLPSVSTPLDEEPPKCPVHQRQCKRAICDPYDKAYKKWLAAYRKSHDGKEPPPKPGPHNVKTVEREKAEKQKKEDEQKKEKQKQIQKEKSQQRKAAAAHKKTEDERQKKWDESGDARPKADDDDNTNPWEDLSTDEEADPWEVNNVKDSSDDQVTRSPKLAEYPPPQSDSDNEEPW